MALGKGAKKYSEEERADLSEINSQTKTMHACTFNPSTEKRVERLQEGGIKTTTCSQINPGCYLWPLTRATNKAHYNAAAVLRGIHWAIMRQLFTQPSRGLHHAASLLFHPTLSGNTSLLSPPPPGTANKQPLRDTQHLP